MEKYVTLMKNMGLFALSAMATRLITFLLVPLYTFYLSSEEFGITDMGSTVLSFAVPLLTLSISDGVLRFVIERQDEATRYISAGLAVSIMSCLLFLCALPLTDLSVFGGLGRYKLLFTLMYVSNVIFGYFSSVCRALNQIRLLTLASIFSSLVTSGSAVVLIAMLHKGVSGFFLSAILGAIVGTLLCFLAGRHGRYLRISDWKSASSTFRVLLTYSLPLIPNALFWWMGTSINRFFITGILGISASGLFAAAGKIPNLLNLLSGIVQQAWNLSAFQEYRSKEVGAFFNTVYKIYAAVMFSGTAVIILLSHALAQVLLQKDFLSSWTLIPLLLIAFLFSTLSAFYGSVFTAGMHTSSLFTSTAVGGILCVILNWLLIPWMGLPGAAAAMIVSNAAVWLIRVRAAQRFIHIRTHWLSLLLCLAVLTAESWIVLHTTGTLYWVAGMISVALICGIQIGVLLPILHRSVPRRHISSVEP